MKTRKMIISSTIYYAKKEGDTHEYFNYESVIQ